MNIKRSTGNSGLHEPFNILVEVQGPYDGCLGGRNVVQQKLTPIRFMAGLDE